jgi:hypothetical protein
MEKINFFLCLGLLLILVLGCGDASTERNKSSGEFQRADSSIYYDEHQSESLPKLTVAIKLDTIVGSPSQEIQDQAWSLTKKLMDSLPTGEISGTKYWLVDGDIRVDRDELYDYCQQRIALLDTVLARKYAAYNGLTIKGDSSRLVVWEKPVVLKYAILKKSFDSRQDYKKYREVVRRMATAAKEWMDICDVKFEYVPIFDNLPADSEVPDELTFLVRFKNQMNDYIASSFYPNDPAYKRKLFVYPKYFNCKYDSVGIFRHELGHTLGYRHEMIWSKDSVCAKDEQIIVNNIGAYLINNTYDKNSVMHYQCGSYGNLLLQFTSDDKLGAQQTYGPKRNH